MITSDTWKRLRLKMLELGIHEIDIQEKFITGSGKGGQKINKTASCVSLQYLPSHIIIKCQQGRSRETNRYYARKRLCEKIEELLYKEKSTHQQAIEKIRRQKRRRSRKAQQKILDDKNAKSATKALRKPPTENE